MYIWFFFPLSIQPRDGEPLRFCHQYADCSGWSAGIPLVPLLRGGMIHEGLQYCPSWATKHIELVIDFLSEMVSFHAQILLLFYLKPAVTLQHITTVLL